MTNCLSKKTSNNKRTFAYIHSFTVKQTTHIKK